MALRLQNSVQCLTDPGGLVLSPSTCTCGSGLRNTQRERHLSLPSSKPKGESRRGHGRVKESPAGLRERPVSSLSRQQVDWPCPPSAPGGGAGGGPGAVCHEDQEDPQRPREQSALHGLVQRQAEDRELLAGTWRLLCAGEWLSDFMVEGARAFFSTSFLGFPPLALQLKGQRTRVWPVAWLRVLLHRGAALIWGDLELVLLKRCKLYLTLHLKLFLPEHTSRSYL